MKTHGNTEFSKLYFRQKLIKKYILIFFSYYLIAALSIGSPISILASKEVFYVKIGAVIITLLFVYFAEEMLRHKFILPNPDKIVLTEKEAVLYYVFGLFTMKYNLKHFYFLKGSDEMDETQYRGYYLDEKVVNGLPPFRIIGNINRSVRSDD